MHSPEKIENCILEVDYSRWSNLCSAKEFWNIFLADLKQCKASLILASPFLTNDGTWKMINMLKDLIARKVNITVYTRPKEEHFNRYSFSLAYNRLQRLGIPILTVSKLRQKLAIIDESLWWEGNMNLLGAHDSPDQMQRFKGTAAKTMLIDLHLQKPNEI